MTARWRTLKPSLSLRDQSIRPDEVMAWITASGIFPNMIVEWSRILPFESYFTSKVLIDLNEKLNN